MQNALYRFSLLFVIMISLVACQAPKLQVLSEQSPDFDEEKYASFKVQHTHTDVATRAEELLNDAITHVMTEKGYVDGADPDLIILYSIRTTESRRLEIDPTAAPNLGGSGAPNLPQLEAVFEARMLINVVDARTGKVVWKAASTRDLTQVNVSKFDADRAHDRMHEMFESFPNRFDSWF